MKENGFTWDAGSFSELKDQDMKGFAYSYIAISSV